MLTFIPSWKTPSYDGLSNDDLIGQIQAYQESGQAYQVIIRDYIPELRYFLHRYDLLECRYHSVFDHLQGSVSFEQRQLQVEDLSFSETASFHYTPYCMLVRERGEEVGRIYFGEGSHIHEVQYFETGQLVSIVTYDARGFISRQQTFREGKASDLIYLDVEGEWVFCVELDGVCRVNPENSKGLSSLIYPSLEALELECVSWFIEASGDAPLLVSVDEGILSWIAESPLKSRMSLSLFKERFSYSASHLSLLSSLAPVVRGIIVDSERGYAQLSRVLPSSSLSLLSPYDTRFSLSKSQEYDKEVIYIDLRKSSTNKSQFILETLISYSEQSYLSKGRELQLVFRVNDWMHKEAIEERLQQYLAAHYGDFLEELSFFEKIGGGSPTSQGLPFQVELSAEAKWLKVFQEDLEVAVIAHDDDFFKWMHVVRLIIDLGSPVDLFTQIAGLSAGVPQLNSVSSLYMKDKANGWVISCAEDLHIALVHFLDQLSAWQESRVFSVQEIKRHSGLELQRKLSKIVGDESVVR